MELEGKIIKILEKLTESMKSSMLTVNTEKTQIMVLTSVQRSVVIVYTFK